MARVASSRVRPSRPPVRTNDIPARVWGSSAPVSPSALVLTPASTRRRTRSWLASSANQAARLAGGVGPAPPTAARRPPGGGAARPRGLEAVGEQGAQGAADVPDGRPPRQPVQGALLGGLDRPQE